MSVAASNRSQWTPWLGLVVLLGLQLPASALGAAELPPLSHRLTALGEPAPAPALRLQDLDGNYARPRRLARAGWCW